MILKRELFVPIPLVASNVNVVMATLEMDMTVQVC